MGEAACGAPPVVPGPLVRLLGTGAGHKAVFRCRLTRLFRLRCDHDRRRVERQSEIQVLRIPPWLAPGEEEAADAGDEDLLHIFAIFQIAAGPPSAQTAGNQRSIFEFRRISNFVLLVGERRG